MISAMPQTQALIEQLLGVLDEEIALMDIRKRQLGDLSAAMLARDDDAMEKVLVEMERAQQAQTLADMKLSSTRAAISGAFGLRAGECRLHRLVQYVSPEHRAALEYRRQQIDMLSRQLRRQHMSTVVQLVESARVNRMLLESLLGGGKETLTTYGAGGQQNWRGSSGLVDAEL